MKKELEAFAGRVLCALGRHAWVFEKEILGRMKRVDRCDRPGCEEHRQVFTGKPYDHSFKDE